MGQPMFCTEAQVRQIVQFEVNRSVMAYEKKVGNPRHTENQKLLNQISGGVKALKWIGSILLALATLLVAIYAAWRHH